jgi:rhodanese-related sulfurtransferase
MKKFVAALCLILLSASAALCADAPSSPAKRTEAGKYVTAIEASTMLGKDHSGHLIDVRTPEEYVFLGHAVGATNIPVKLWVGKFDAVKSAFPLSENQDFVKEVEARFDKRSLLLLMCRSGDRSAIAVDKLARVGFTNVWTVIDGFEGDAGPDGKRDKNGWRNSGLPWNYALDAAHIHETAGGR